MSIEIIETKEVKAEVVEQSRRAFRFEYKPGSVAAAVHDITVGVAILELLEPGRYIRWDQQALSYLHRLVTEDLERQRARLVMESVFEKREAEQP